VQELAIWKPLAAHIEEQVARGRPVLVELDYYFLPDTAGTAYRRLHWKSTAAWATSTTRATMKWRETTSSTCCGFAASPIQPFSPLTSSW
jgi:hypothetical protein